jgi:hypothetical protein
MERSRKVELYTQSSTNLHGTETMLPLHLYHGWLSHMKVKHKMMTASVVQWSEFLVTERRCIVFPVRYELSLCMLCRRK